MPTTSWMPVKTIQPKYSNHDFLCRNGAAWVRLQGTKPVWSRATRQAPCAGFAPNE